MKPREYRPDDFDDDRGMFIVAMFATVIYGVVLGIAGTLFVQWPF